MAQRAAASSHPPPEPGAASVERLVLVPVFDDWRAVSMLLPIVDRTLASAGLDAFVMLVDDGSRQTADELELPAFRAIRAVDVLALRRNLGHQRALSVGLAYAEQNVHPDVVIVMDGDGEDDPKDIPALLAMLEQGGRSTIVFAERKRRSEPMAFRALYHGYRLLHRVLTGYRVRVGNYSVIPRAALARLVVVSETWNHYAAAVFNARIGYTTVPSARARRLDGRSKMNFVALVAHGLSALSVYSAIIGVRVLVATGVLVAMLIAALAAFAGLAAVHVGGLPNGLLYLAGALLVILLQVVVAAGLFVFVMLAGRQGSSFIPIRDYAYFVDHVTRLRAPT